jgi:hypothetical protein
VRELVDSRIDIDGADVDPKMRPVLRYARKLTQQPSSLTQADADAIFAAGWEEPTLYYTVAVTALFNFMLYFNSVKRAERLPSEQKNRALLARPRPPLDRQCEIMSISGK